MKEKEQHKWRNTKAKTKTVYKPALILAQKETKRFPPNGKEDGKCRQGETQSRADKHKEEVDTKAKIGPRYFKKGGNAKVQ